MDKYSNNLRTPGAEDTDSRDKMVKILTVSLAVVLVALIGVTYYFLSRYEKKPEVADTNMAPANQNQAATNQQAAPVQQAPQVTVSTWEAQVTPPAAPASMDVYKMKQNYTTAEIQTIASRLSANAGVEESASSVIAFSDTGDNILVMNKVSGDYAFSSSTGVALPAAASQNESVYAMLRNIGMYDDTIKVTATYMKKSTPGVKYVELHRSWTDVKMPILSSVGVINIPENIKLSQLALGRATADTPTDADIMGTSDASDNMKRRDDFNTVVVGISEADNKVVSIKSNVRVLLPERMTVAGIAQADVMTALEANRQNMIFTSPSGDGAADFSKIYTGNQVMAEMATVTDIGLAYIEQAPTVAQTELVPHYVVRGFMESDTGYRLNFVATVPAGKTPQAKIRIPGIISRIAGAIVGTVHAQVDDPGQKQGTLTFPTTGPETQPGGVDFNSSCTPSEADMVAGSVHEFNGLRVGFAKRPDKKDFEWYYLNREGKDPQQIVNDVQALLQQIKDTVPDTQDAEFREKVKQLMKDIAATPDCPVRFTGSSPTVFAYGPEGTEMQVTVGGNTTYAEPAKADNAWNVTVENDGLDVNGVDRDYIYYEYETVDFARPTQGWVVSRTQLDALATEIAGRMEMNAVEAVRLNFELNHALADVESDRVFVGMIDRAEVDAKLPMNVSPMPEAVARYHFYVGSEEGAAQAPVLLPIDRGTTMVLEVGAAGYNN